jgi:hypothetical protein
MRWIDAREVADTGKTKSYTIVARVGGAQLGVVKWFNRWVCYAFFPEPATVFDSACLDDLRAFLASLMAARRKAS